MMTGEPRWVTRRLFSLPELLIPKRWNYPTLAQRLSIRQPMNRILKRYLSLSKNTFWAGVWGTYPVRVAKPSNLPIKGIHLLIIQYYNWERQRQVGANRALAAGCLRYWPGSKSTSELITAHLHPSIHYCWRVQVPANEKARHLNPAEVWMEYRQKALTKW